MSLSDLELTIYGQAVDNYKKYVARCLQRALEAKADLEKAAEDLAVMQRKFEFLKGGKR